MAKSKTGYLVLRLWRLSDATNLRGQLWYLSSSPTARRLVTSREYVSLQLQKQGGPCVLRLVHLSLKWGVIALRQRSVRNVRKEGLN